MRSGTSAAGILIDPFMCSALYAACGRVSTISTERASKAAFASLSEIRFASGAGEGEALVFLAWFVVWVDATWQAVKTLKINIAKTSK